MSVKDALDAECHLRARVREETADPEWALREFVSLAANGSAISSGGALCLTLSRSIELDLDTNGPLVVPEPEHGEQHGRHVLVLIGDRPDVLITSKPSADANAATPLIVVQERASVLLANLTVRGGATAGGALVAMRGSTLFARDVVVRDARSGLDGGAICSHGARVVLERCTLTRNTARRGGAVFATGGGDGDTVIATDTLISLHHTLLVGNVADEAGGAFHIDDSMNVPGTYPKAHITTSTFEDNTALGAGGAVYAQGARIVAEGTDFIGNAALGRNVSQSGIVTNGPRNLVVPGATLVLAGASSEMQLINSTVRSRPPDAGRSGLDPTKARLGAQPVSTTPAIHIAQEAGAYLEGVTVTGDARATFPLFAADQDANAELYSSAFDVTWHMGDGPFEPHAPSDFAVVSLNLKAHSPYLTATGYLPWTLARTTIRETIVNPDNVPLSPNGSVPWLLEANSVVELIEVPINPNRVLFRLPNGRVWSCDDQGEWFSGLHGNELCPCANVAPEMGMGITCADNSSYSALPISIDDQIDMRDQQEELVPLDAAPLPSSSDQSLSPLVWAGIGVVGCVAFLLAFWCLAKTVKPAPTPIEEDAESGLTALGIAMLTRAAIDGHGYVPLNVAASEAASSVVDEEDTKAETDAKKVDQNDSNESDASESPISESEDDDEDEIDLIAEIGHGRFAQVHFARWCDRSVAIKRPIRASCAARLRHEFELLAPLRHPNVVHILFVEERALSDAPIPRARGEELGVIAERSRRSKGSSGEELGVIAERRTFKGGVDLRVREKRPAGGEDSDDEHGAEGSYSEDATSDLNERAAGDRRRGSALSGCSQSDDSLATSAAEASDPAVPQFALVMELAEHGSLAMLLPSQGRSVSWRHPLFRIAHGVVRALEYLHAPPVAIAHGDLRPPNVLLRADYEPVLCDFDCARRLDDTAAGSAASATGAMIAHPPTSFYIAPERCAAPHARRVRGGTPNRAPAGATAAADMYSFGMLLVRLARPTLSMRAIMAESRSRADSSSESEAPFSRSGVKQPEKHPHMLVPAVDTMPRELVTLTRDCIAERMSKRPTARAASEILGACELNRAPSPDCL